MVTHTGTYSMHSTTRWLSHCQIYHTRVLSYGRTYPGRSTTVVCGYRSIYFGAGHSRAGSEQRYIAWLVSRIVDYDSLYGIVVIMKT